MKRAAIILVLMIVATAAHAQKERSSSFKKFSKAATDPRDQLNKAALLRTKNPARALDLIKDALGVSVAQGDVISEGKGYMLIGQINEDIQEWQLAADNYSEACAKLRTSFIATNEFKQSLSGLGRSNLRLGNFDAALQNFEEALNLVNSVAEIDEIKLRISEAHYGLGQYDAALKDLETPRQGSLSSSNTAQTINQRAKIFARTNKLADSRDLYSNSLKNKQYDSLGPADKKSFDDTKEVIADALRAQNQPDEEIQLRNNSISVNKASNSLSAVAKDQVAIAKTLEAAGNPTAAIHENEKAASAAASGGDPVEEANALQNLARLYEKTQQDKKALAAWNRYSAAVAKKDSAGRKELLRKTDLIVKQREIEEVTKQIELGKGDVSAEHAAYLRQQLIIYGLLLLVVVVAVTSWFIFRNARASKRANQLLALKSLRSQMNPHFIFNALNSVNHFIAEQDERSANRFLSEFSQLMRLVLENSQLDFIPLHKEQEILALYLKLEHYRFRDKFEYSIKSDDDIPAESIAVPPMLIQPYIENAVWHGLRYKTTPGELTLQFRKEADFIVAEITDDGIGRKRSQELKTENQRKHTSTGLKNIEERIGMINRLYHTNYRVHIEDRPAGTGTRVVIHMPLVHTIKEAV